MNNPTQMVTGKIRRLTGAVLLGTRSGCASYQEAPAPRQVAYEQPPAVQLEASDGMAEVSIRTESDFYQPLTPYGRWQVVGSYGRCWIPGRVDADWRPYSGCVPIWSARPE